jgi:hypothetical protein
VPAEAAFSFASQIVTKRRNRLAGETVRYIMCLHDWGPCLGPKWMEEPENSGGKMDVAGARAGGTADVDDGMSSSGGMEGSGPELF